MVFVFIWIASLVVYFIAGFVANVIVTEDTPSKTILNSVLWALVGILALSSPLQGLVYVSSLQLFFVVSAYFYRPEKEKELKFEDIQDIVPSILGIWMIVGLVMLFVF